jgi:hypothetical protein
MTHEELCWLAGWLEGEGCFCFKDSPRGARILVQVFSTDLDVLERAATLMMSTNILTIPPRACVGTQWKSRGGWRTEVQGQKAADLMRLLLPLMGRRRSAAISAALNGWDNRRSKPITKQCACGCGAEFVAGPRRVYLNRNHNIRAWRKGRRRYTTVHGERTIQ